MYSFKSLFMEGLGLIHTPLCLAARDGQLDIIRQLLQKGHNINLPDNAGSTPLHVAAAQGHVECIKFFLDQEECNPHALTFEGFSTIFVACKFQDNPEIIRLLIKAGVDCNKGSLENLTPLHVACKNLKYEIVQELIRSGADVNSKDFNSYTPLTEAIEQYCVVKKSDGQRRLLDIIELLLDNGANLSTSDLHGRTPLLLAVWVDWEDLVKVLIERGAEINTRTTDGSTALVLAAQRGNLIIVRHLLEYGADPCISCFDNSLPLHQAVHNGYMTIASELYKKMTNYDIERSFLILALDSGFLESLNFVLKNKLTKRSSDQIQIVVWDLQLDRNVFGHYKWMGPLSFLLNSHIDEIFSIAMVNCLLESDFVSVNAGTINELPPLCALIGAPYSCVNSEFFHENQKKSFFKLLEKGVNIDYCSVEYLEALDLRVPDAVAAVVVAKRCSTYQNLLLPVLAHCFSCNWDKLLKWLLENHVCCVHVVRVLLSLASKISISVANMWISSKKCPKCSEHYPKIQEMMGPRVSSLQSLSRIAVRSWLWETTHESSRAKQLLKKLKIPEIIEDYIIPKNVLLSDDKFEN